MIKVTYDCNGVKKGIRDFCEMKKPPGGGWNLCNKSSLGL